MRGRFLFSKSRWRKGEIFGFHGPEIECDACGMGLGKGSNGLVVQLNGFREGDGVRHTDLLLKCWEDEFRASLFACRTRETMVGRRRRRLLICS